MSRDLVDEAIAAGWMERMPDDLHVRAALGKPTMTGPCPDAIRLAEMIQRVFQDLPKFGDRVVVLREGCGLQAEAKRVLRDAEKASQS